MKLAIVYKKTDALIPYVNNSRTHTENQITQIASSIREFGFTNPILLDGDDGIIAGHGRLAAAQKLGLKEVPTIDLSHLTPAQRKTYIIADNKLALNAGWDEELLKLELEDLGDGELAFTGFSAEELNLLFNGWNSDIERMSDIDAKDSLSKDRIIVKCNPDQKEMVWEAITNAVDSLGLDDVEVS